MKSLLVYLKNYKKESILAPLFKMLEASFELLVPLVMAAIIDVGIANRDKEYIIKMCLVLIGLGLIGLTCSVTAQYYSAKAAAGFGVGVRKALFSHIQKFGFAEMDECGSATLVTRMTSDVNQAQSGVNLVLRLFLRSPFIVAGAMIMAFTVDVKAAVTFAVVIPLLSIVVFGIMLITMPMYKKVQSNLDQVLLTTRENLTGARVIRAFNKEKEERKQFEKKNHALTETQKFVGKISGLMNPLTYVIVNGGIVVLIYVGALRVNAGSLTQGEVVALLNYMSQILVELIKLANLIITMTKAVACGNRIEAVMNVVPEIHMELEEEKKTKNQEVDQANENCDVPAVVFSSVSMKYRGAGAETLTNISFQAKEGQIIGVIGGTGSGKTSLVHLIPRFYDVSSGEVNVFGKNVKDYSVLELRKLIGVVFQQSVLFKGTIEENLRWGNENASEEELQQALEISQAKEFVEEKPGGLQFMIEQSGRNLSGGQKQRLSIARALVKKPKILILDDSASALDYATEAALRSGLARWEENPTLFIVSQRAASIRHADQILVLDDGKLVGIGTHDQLLKTCPVYQEIYYSQFSEEEPGNE